MYQNVLCTFLFIITLYTVPAWAATPANPATNDKAVAVLNYLEQLPQRSEGRMLSGQFCNYGLTASKQPCEDVFQVTGHWPAIIGLDYADWSTSGLNTEIPNQVAMAYDKAGGWVTISAHLYNPANPAGGGLRDKGVDLKQLLTPGTDTYTRWMAELDCLAAGLAALQEANVVVLWRPFHEMNGGWFWWGGHKPADFIALWKQMFTYFTETKKVKQSALDIWTQSWFQNCRLLSRRSLRRHCRSGCLHRQY